MQGESHVTLATHSYPTSAPYALDAEPGMVRSGGLNETVLGDGPAALSKVDIVARESSKTHTIQSAAASMPYAPEAGLHMAQRGRVEILKQFWEMAMQLCPKSTQWHGESQKSGQCLTAWNL